MKQWPFDPKPSVDERRKKAARDVQRLTKRGEKLSPVVIDGPVIASSFWGKAWCANLESYRDYENRLPRGRSYVRHGAVLDLAISAGKLTALVSGTDVYTVTIQVKPLAEAHWSRIKTQCSGQVGSLIELLEGRLSEHVMQIVTHRDHGLFPKPAEINLECSCPDWATMCKHVAAVLYGVGARLDQQPELLFTLRAVNHAELLTAPTVLDAGRGPSKRKRLALDELGSVFGIDLDPGAVAAEPPTATPTPIPTPSRKQKPRSPRSAAPEAPRRPPKRRP
jgi:uncharacterized Zn finger protein